jgi:hypothetical protein
MTGEAGNLFRVYASMGRDRRAAPGKGAVGTTATMQHKRPAGCGIREDMAGTVLPFRIGRRSLAYVHNGRSRQNT